MKLCINYFFKYFDLEKIKLLCFLRKAYYLPNNFCWFIRPAHLESVITLRFAFAYGFLIANRSIFMGRLFEHKSRKGQGR